MALKHLPHREVYHLILIFKAILLSHQFAAAWKHARAIFILIPRKDPALTSSYRPINHLHKIDILFEIIILARVLHGFRPWHSTFLQLARLVDRITRNDGEKRLTGAVSLDVAKTFDTVWIDGHLYKLTLLNFPSYIAHTISYYHRARPFEASLLTATSCRRGMRPGVAQGGLIFLYSTVCTLATCPQPGTTSC